MHFMALGSAWLGSNLVLVCMVCFPRLWCWLCWLAGVLIRMLRVCQKLQLWLKLQANWLWSGVTDLQQVAVAVAIVMARYVMLLHPT